MPEVIADPCPTLTDTAIARTGPVEVDAGLVEVDSRVAGRVAVTEDHGDV